MPRILLVLEYDGAAFCGWQRQRHKPSVQQAMETALGAITGEPIEALKLACAGRTDAGVHARGQRVSFDSQSRREPRRFAPALNHVLPPSIRVHHAGAVAPDFDVRRAARAKWYRYSAHVGLHPSALWGRRAWHVRKRLDLPRLQQALPALLGEHDFESFRSAHCDAAHARRRIDVLRAQAQWCPPVGWLLHLDVVGNAFCRHMVRIIAGSAIDVGCGALPPDALATALQARQRHSAGQTAPAHGLTLMDIAYADAMGAGVWPFGWPEPPTPARIPHGARPPW